jgi:hypothetical protein
MSYSWYTGLGITVISKLNITLTNTAGIANLCNFLDPIVPQKIVYRSKKFRNINEKRHFILVNFKR